MRFIITQLDKMLFGKIDSKENLQSIQKPWLKQTTLLAKTTTKDPRQQSQAMQVYTEHGNGITIC